AYFSFFENKARHNSDFRFFRSDNSRTVRADEPAISVSNVRFYFDHISYRNSFGNTNDYFDTGFGSLHNGICSERRRHKNNGNIGPGFFHSISHGIENRLTKMLRTSFSGGNTSYH